MQTSDEEIQKLREHILAEIDLTREMSDTEIRAIVSEKMQYLRKTKNFLKTVRAGSVRTVSVPFAPQAGCVAGITG